MITITFPDTKNIDLLLFFGLTRDASDFGPDLFISVFSHSERANYVMGVYQIEGLKALALRFKKVDWPLNGTLQRFIISSWMVTEGEP